MSKPAPGPRSVVAYPGVMQHAQQVALALHEAGVLETFVTAYVFREDSALNRVLAAGIVPGGQGLLRQLRRRTVGEIPADKVRAYPFWELLRSVASRVGVGAVTVDRLWDRTAHAFDRTVARHHIAGTCAIHAFEYTALESFRAAQALGVQRVLHLPSLDSRAFETLRRQEQDKWPELATPEDGYFHNMFARRYERRCEEIRLADRIIVNSSLTARSHIAAGADASKIAVVSLGAPAVAPGAPGPASPAGEPLRVLWAGSLQLRKGAHYFLEAWRGFAAGRHAQAQIYGQVEMPAALLADLPDNLTIQPSVPQPELWAAFERADVLVFPTLSDGFGMVVTEALSRGLPVITTNQAGAADLIEHGSNGLLIPPADAPALKNALQWCLDNRDALARMRIAAIATARDNQWSDYRARLREAVGLPGALPIHR